MTTLSPKFNSILDKYNRAKLNTYKVLELLGNDYTFNDYGADVLNKHYEELLSCGTVLVFHKEVTSAEPIYHLTHSNFCRKRICPMCQFRKSERTFAETLKLTDVLEEQGFRFLHLVLTIPNSKNGAELAKDIKRLYKYFGKFWNNREIKKAFKGCMRCLEISYNYDNDTFHPHLHCLVAVRQSYFNDSKVYLSYDKLRDIWSISCGLDITQGIRYQINVRAMKKGDKVGVAEVCKYCVKPLDLGERSMERDIQNMNVLLTLSHTLKGTRFLQRYGVIKDVYKELFKNDDETLIDRVDTDSMTKQTLFWNTSTLCYDGG